MTAPCSRCLRVDCSASCIRVEEALERQRLAEGTQTGTSKLIGQRVVCAYQHYHQREKVTETRYAFGHVTKIFPDGAMWVVTDREGGMRVEATNVEIVQ